MTPRPTHIQAHLAAQELSLKRAADDPAKLTRALVEARVDLNPHQVDAALFAFSNPLSRGAILADEVGLGKTIEAGLVATQHWAERRRSILVLCPASLRTQWRDELAEKFFLPSLILDRKALDASERPNPFDTASDGDKARIVIASYTFAARQQEFLMTVPWDLAILDEAHRLRNVFKGAKIAVSIQQALANTPKMLLTATPLQNSLLELYGLVSFIDETAFGDARTFSAKYARVGKEGERFDELKARLEPLCHRTLRRQVVEYVSYTKRQPLTQEFRPTEAEQTLYDGVSAYLQRESLAALPNAQRALITLVLRKLLASSTFAIAGALDTMVKRLSKALREGEAALAAAGRDDRPAPESDVEELLDELLEDHLDASVDTETADAEAEAEAQPLSRPQLDTIAAEIADLAAFRDLARDITENAKGAALLVALGTAFEKASELGAARKAVVFTESRRTQEYLVGLLHEHGFGGKVVRFSGTNNDADAKRIYAEWRERLAGSDRITGSRAIDVRAALVDAFKGDAEIMIATEAAAEGINLQFCSIVVNYDLPWNPQRVEQRIGRCHRYGQRNDVLVVNFLNQSNAADQRVYELLAEKFRLFEGVFGASDEVLGSIESGVDIERRIADIYQLSRTQEQIDDQFEQLQLEFSEAIDAEMASTRTKLLEHFDAQVHDRLRVRLEDSRTGVDRHQDLLLGVVRFALDGRASFSDDEPRFTIDEMPDGVPLDAPRTYSAVRPADEDRAHHLRPTDALAQWAVARALEAPPADVLLSFDYTGWPVRSVDLDGLVGRGGVLHATKLSITGKESEEHLLLVAVTDDGSALVDDQVERLLLAPATTRATGGTAVPERLRLMLEAQQDEKLASFAERRDRWLGGEYDKLDRWAEDERARLREDVTDLDRQIKESRRAISDAGTEPDRLPLRRKKLLLERQLDAARRDYDAAVSSVAQRQEEMLDTLENALSSQHTSEVLFTIRWEVT